MTQLTQMDSLRTLMEFIGARYQFTPENYPEMEGMSEEQKKAFAVSHSAHHMMKSLGRIATECESYDHGSRMNGPALREATVKMLINTLKLAEELGMTPEELANAVPDLMKSK